MIEYRKATLDDIDDLIEFRIEFLTPLETEHESTPDELKNALWGYFDEYLTDNTFIAWLAEDNGKIIATSGLSFYTVPPYFNNLTGKVAYIMNMYTKPEYRRKGIGTELFRRLLEEAKAGKITKIVLHATDIGRPLYEKFGFTSDGSEMILKIKE